MFQGDSTMQPSDKRKLTLYLPVDLADRLKEAADRDGVAQGGLVEAALRVFLSTRPPRRLRAGVKDARRGPVQALAVALRLRRKSTPAMLKAIAAHLNREGFRTLQGRTWNVVAVSRLLKQGGLQ